MLKSAVNVITFNCNKSIHEWDNEEGQGNYISEYNIIEKTYSDIEMFSPQYFLQKFIENELCFTYDPNNLTIIDNRVIYTQLENEEGYEDQHGKYICDYDIYITYNFSDFTEEDCRELFPDIKG